MSQQQSQKYQAQSTPSLYEPAISDEDTATKLQPVHQHSLPIQRDRNRRHQDDERIRWFKRLDHVLSGAMLATFVGAISVLMYLLTTTYGFGFAGTPLIDYVLANSFGGAFDTSEVLTVIVARFLLGFGLTWTPLTMAVAFFEWFGRYFGN